MNDSIRSRSLDRRAGRSYICALGRSSLKLSHGKVGAFEYTLFDADSGAELDASSPGEPLRYLHGHGEIVPGLEQALEGKAPGASLEVVVEPAQAYGSRVATRVVTIPRDQLEVGGELSAGDCILTDSPLGDEVPVWITHIDAERVTLDGNHPLAGRRLRFRVRLTDVRDATHRELEVGTGS